MPSKRELLETVNNLSSTLDDSKVERANLEERLDSLELALEDYGWIRMSWDFDREFSRGGLRTIAKLSRYFYLKNPLVQRGVDVQSHYVFGQGVNIAAEDEDVNVTIQAFMDDRKNQAELTSHQALLGKETELQVEGNLFFTFFVNQGTGGVVVRTIPADEIDLIVKNPDDRKEPWFYKRTASMTGFDLATGNPNAWAKETYYPDWQYSPEDRLASIGDKEILWDIPVFHVKVGGLPTMDFGVPEPYSALDWARAYTEFLENWSSIVKAYAMFAFKLTTPAGSAGVAAAKTKLASTINTSSSSETNPPPLVGSTFIGTDKIGFEPIRTAGATTSAEDGRRLLLMVASSMGLPETFFGDVSVGTLATAKSLDRPTELKMASRQKLWSSVLTQIIDYVLVQAVKYGKLPGKLVQNENEPDSVELENPGFSVDFPPILEHDVGASVEALVNAATLGGNMPAGTIPDMKMLSRMLLNELGAENIDEMVEQMFPEDAEPTEAARLMVKAVTELRESIARLVDAGTP